MKINKIDFSTIWFDNNKIKIIDQTKLPFELKIKELKSLESFVNAIRNMEVRGAPLIGVTAAFGLAFEIIRNPNKISIFKAFKKLCDSRPTAINLRWALEELTYTILKMPQEKRGEESLKIAKRIREDDINSCKKIGEYGLKIIENIYKKKKKCVNILTHCNAGWLATVDWGKLYHQFFWLKEKFLYIFGLMKQDPEIKVHY